MHRPRRLLLTAALPALAAGCHGRLDPPSQWDVIEDWRAAEALGQVEPAAPAVARGENRTAVLWGANGTVSGARLRPDGSWSLSRSAADFAPSRGVMLPDGRAFFVDRFSLREYTKKGELRTIDRESTVSFESVFRVTSDTIGVVKSSGIEFRDTVRGTVWAYPIALPQGASDPFAIDDDRVGVLFVETRAFASSTVRQLTIGVRTGATRTSDVSATGLFIRGIAYDTTAGSPSVVWVQESRDRFESWFCRLNGSQWLDPERIDRFQDSGFEFEVAVDANYLGEAAIAVVGLDYRALCYRDTAKVFGITELGLAGLPRKSFEVAVNRGGEAILLDRDAQSAVQAWELRPGAEYFTSFGIRGEGRPIPGTQALVHPDDRHAAIVWLETVDPNLYWSRRTR